MSAPIAVARDGHVTTIMIDRPHVRNALDLASQHALAAAFDAFAADDDQWVAILTGRGDKAFCAGFELGTPVVEGPDELPRGGFGGLTARFDLDKPVIAAVNGFAVGGGFEMALACDIVVAAPGASFALPEVKVGLTALAGGVLRLPRAVGLQRAMGMMLTGRLVGAAEGLAAGFVTEIAEDGDVLACARRWADLLLAAAPLAVRATKAAALRHFDTPLEQAMVEQWNDPAVRRAIGSEDAIEGPLAFKERRPPNWAGR